MNILVVHETEYIEKVVFEYQIIPEIWASKGHNIYVIDYPAAWKKKNWFDFGSLRTQFLPNVQRAKKKRGVTLIRPGVIKIPGLDRLFAFIAYFFIVPKVIKKYKIEKIMLYSVPTNSLQTLFWAKLYKIPVHFRLLDVLNQLVPNKTLSKITYKMERMVYKRVNELTAVTPKLTNYAIAMEANSETTTYLPTASDLDLFYYQDKDPDLLTKYNIKKNETVVLFAGTLYNFSGLDHLIKYWAKHKNNYPGLKFLILGHGEQTETLQQLIKAGGLENKVILTGFIDYAELNKYINLADICTNPFEINKVTEIIFPSKVYQYLACEKPVIATRLSGMIDIFPDNNGKNNIYYFNYKKPKEFFDLVLKIKRRKIKDLNPSLQDISTILEKRLKEL
jgi:glycosyltransferase involved in cell wall biosynthesis